MQSIGERLEEARKRRGISIREASEATKIRGDFLLNFENNQFDVGLPDIYVRGFLRNYSGFLKIDPEKIVTDFNATLIGETKSRGRDSRELFGRMELPERPRPTVEGNAPASPTAPRRREEPAPQSSLRTNAGTSNPELANYLKVGAIIVAGIAAILLIVYLVMLIIGTTQTSDRPRTDAPGTTPTQGAGPAEDTITLIAKADVRVTVTQEFGEKILFDGILQRDQRQVITRRGAVRIKYDNGANLQVEKGGRIFGMSVDGVGRSKVD